MVKLDDKQHVYNEIRYFIDCINGVLHNPVFNKYVPAHYIYTAALDEFIYLNMYYKNKYSIDFILPYLAMVIDYTQNKKRINKEILQKLWTKFIMKFEEISEV